jgi:uncharacterized integral membrane protein (TIGR00698 family)
VISTLKPYRCAIERRWPGVAVAGMVALAASFIAASYGGPQLLYALFFGLSLHFLAQHPGCRPGIEFCSTTVLRFGVALLGARVTLPQISALGGATIALVCGAVVTTIGLGYLLARALGRPSAEGILSGGAVGICGASAALAIAAALPQTKENERYTLLTIVGVTTLSTLAMIIYPVVVRLAGLTPDAAGVFIGGSIHDVAQVVGAGYLISNHTGDIATVVKLTRVAMLVPVVLLLSVLYHSREGRTEFNLPTLVPTFLVAFVLLMLANTFSVFPPAAVQAMSSVSRACLVTAIAALGIKTSLQSLAALGWRPVVMLVAETVWIAGFVLIAAWLMWH